MPDNNLTSSCIQGPFRTLNTQNILNLCIAQLVWPLSFNSNSLSRAKELRLSQVLVPLTYLNEGTHCYP